MITAAIFHHVANYFHMTIHIRDVCVFLAPMFSSFTVIVTYLLTKELKVCTVYIIMYVMHGMHCRMRVRVCARRQ